MMINFSSLVRKTESLLVGQPRDTDGEEPRLAKARYS
jgi:hypothetical protein